MYEDNNAEDLFFSSFREITVAQKKFFPYLMDIFVFLEVCCLELPARLQVRYFGICVNRERISVALPLVLKLPDGIFGCLCMLIYHIYDPLSQDLRIYYLLL